MPDHDQSSPRGIATRGARLRLDRTGSGYRRDHPGIGIDFGTTNSAAAIFDGERVTVVRLEPAATIMPSASYIDREFSVSTGNDAITRYIQANRGRRVELRAEVLGEGRRSTGQIDPATGIPGTADTETFYGRELDDAGLPGRLFHGTKRLLGSHATERVVVFGKPFRLIALVTPILVKIRQAIDDALRNRSATDHAATHACIGYPVKFEGHGADNDRLAIARLSEAHRHAGVVEQQFCPEPIAAAISYLHAHPESRQRRLLTVDFGGGTLDLCVLRSDDKALEVEAVHGIALGGNKIDQAIFRHTLFPLLGKGEMWSRTVEGRRVETNFPFWMYEERLLNWQVTYTLNQNKYTTPLIDQMSREGQAAEKFRRLYHLIVQNYGYETFGAIRGLKEHLTLELAGRLDIPEIDVHLGMGRHELDSMIANALDRFGRAIDETLDTARLGASDIDLVLRTGGSCLIPAFENILLQRFPGKVVDQNPFTSVAAGLAIADYYGFGNHESGVR